MQHVNFSFAVLALIALLAGCAGGRDGPRTPTGTDGGPRDLGHAVDMYVPGLDLGGGMVDLGGGPVDLGRADAGRRCTPSCATDADCQASCPSNPTPSLPVCCDRGTGTCFNSSVAMCPSTTPTDGGTTMSM